MGGIFVKMEFGSHYWLNKKTHFPKYASIWSFIIPPPFFFTIKNAY